MNPGIRSNCRLGAMMFLWGYDFLKFMTLFHVLKLYHINPWIFLFLDMITVPTFVLGWEKLSATLTGGIHTFGRLLKWSAVTFVSSTAPYLYAGWAGRQSFSHHAWAVLAVIILIIIINFFKKICRYKRSPKKRNGISSGHAVN